MQRERISQLLTEVMNDIGVNERMVTKRRKTNLLVESINSCMLNLYTEGVNISYNFGSQTECSTTHNLGSDFDILSVFGHIHVIQDVKDYKYGIKNFLMIQNENISPGYCYLQYMRASLNPKVTREVDYSDCVPLCDGTLLVKNTFLKDVPSSFASNPEPAYNTPAKRGVAEKDYVPSLYCKSPPRGMAGWLQTPQSWPPDDIRRLCQSAGCFLVSVGSKMSETADIEWRVSTSLQERYLMFSLNIPQLSCYILMKLILKTHVSPYVEKVLTSFMCKNVLMYCVAKSTREWNGRNLYSYLNKCMFLLKECVLQRNCPHFMIPDNNLLSGKMTDEQRSKLLCILDDILDDDLQYLYRIDIDEFGKRLQMKMGILSSFPNILAPSEISKRISGVLVSSLFWTRSWGPYWALNIVSQESTNLTQALHRLTSLIHRYRSIRSEDMIDYIEPQFSSCRGSLVACRDIENKSPISEEAFKYLNEGICDKSDFLSGRLKLASVLYCIGDSVGLRRLLEPLPNQYDKSRLVSMCGCGVNKPRPYEHQEGFVNESANYDMKQKYFITFCTRFLRYEINCVPHELRYEIYRRYTDIQWRTIEDNFWMDHITVDSVPYLHFLLYKMHGRLQNRSGQKVAFRNMLLSVIDDRYLGHLDTIHNLLGQCWEQENNPHVALFKCYIVSLKIRPRNNAAKILIAILLYKEGRKRGII